MSQAASENPFNLLYIFQTIKKYLVYIAIVVGVSALLAFILTLPFIYKPEFKASTIIYPSSAERYDVINLFHDEPILFLYGTSKEVEKLDNTANTEEVKLHVIDSLNLWDAYGVDPENDESPKYYVYRTYDGNVSTTQVSGNGLEITAYDVDPERAAAIVNVIVKKVDEITHRMVTENKEGILKMYQKGYQELAEQLALYTDSIRGIRQKYNVFNTEYQTQALVQQVMQAEGELAAKQATLRSVLKNSGDGPQAAGLRLEVSALRSRVYSLVNKNSGSSINLESFREGLDQVLALEELCEYLSRDLKDAREKVEYLQMMDEANYTTLFIPEYAQAPDKKARPIRWLILVATVLISSLVSVMGAILADKLTGDEVEA
ncbi:MAG: Wzz/FepE/Etk N-terminal domain-containing protein [Bacteroidota bacterium]